MTPEEFERIAVVLRTQIGPILPPGADAVVVVCTGHKLETGEEGEVEINVTSTAVSAEIESELLRMAAGRDDDDEGEEWKKR